MCKWITSLYLIVAVTGRLRCEWQLAVRCKRASMNYKQRRYVGKPLIRLPTGVITSVRKLRMAIISFVMSVRPSVQTEQHGSHWTNFHEISYSSIFRKSVEKIQVLLNMTTAGTLHEDLRTFVIISRLILLRMINFSDKNCRENRNTRFMLNNCFKTKIIPFMR